MHPRYCDVTMLDNSLGMAATMAMQLMVMRVGGTYLKVSIVQGGGGML